MWKLWVQNWNLRNVKQISCKISIRIPTTNNTLQSHTKCRSYKYTLDLSNFFSALHFVCLPSLTGMAGFFCLRPRRMKKRTSGMKISNASTHWWQRGKREDWLWRYWRRHQLDWLCVHCGIFPSCHLPRDKRWKVGIFAKDCFDTTSWDIFKQAAHLQWPHIAIEIHIDIAVVVTKCTNDSVSGCVGQQVPFLHV